MSNVMHLPHALLHLKLKYNMKCLNQIKFCHKSDALCDQTCLTPDSYTLWEICEAPPQNTGIKKHSKIKKM